MRIKFCTAIVVMMLVGCCLSTNAAPQYTIKDIGTLSNSGYGGYTYACGLNDQGQVVGYSMVSDGSEHAFIWDKGKMTDLGTFAGINCRAQSINNNGQVVGYYRPSNNSFHPWVWQDGNRTDLASSGRAAGINDSGQIIGFNSSGSNSPVIWQGTTAKYISLIPGASSGVGNGINDNGQACGTCFVNGYDRAFMYNGKTTLDLGTLSGNKSSFGMAINNVGQVAGYSTAADGFSHAFIWDNGKMKDLGALGSRYSYATGINDSGQVVGWSANVGDHAFIWKDGKMSDLNSLIAPSSGWLLGPAYGINNKGQIVGGGVYNGQSRAFLLTPIPEPSSILALFCGIGGIGSLVLKKKSSKNR